eukprot:TRINITY_DN9990_c0_g1_i2.p1 TRINITY_DN9990_c0_g1~~TRINITY_DN9990_c0_g1_i2.p1  ORF type:complete len:170 (-),score=13.40 TRINITY_DN9990_c0_g1_i2:544-1053(-)
MSICYDLIYEEIPKLLLELEPYLPRSQRCFGILRNCRDGWRVTSGQVWRSPGDDRKLIGVVIKSTGTVSVWNLDEEIGRVISATLPQKNLELSSANTDFLRIVRSQVNEPLNVYLLHISEEVFEKQCTDPFFFSSHAFNSFPSEIFITNPLCNQTKYSESDGTGTENLL